MEDFLVTVLPKPEDTGGEFGNSYHKHFLCGP